MDGRRIRHALEVRHQSFACPEFIALARAHGAAVILAGDSEHPVLPDLTADFVYVRAMGAREAEPKGYAEAELDRWADRARTWAGGGAPDDIAPVAAPAPPSNGRDVFFYFISGFKPANPDAAMALIDKVA